MKVSLYNTMSREVEEFEPISNDCVTFYSCGPTVYDYPHIGNWYAFIRWDILSRTLRCAGYKVKWVMNITDVGHLVSDADDGEDKLEKGARREGKTAWDVASLYTKYFEESLLKLNFSNIHKLPKATDHIYQQIELVKTLEKNGNTYRIDDGIYFDTSTLSDYGKLARLTRDGLLAGARVELNQQKRNTTDFALWKFSPKNEKRDMEWTSPWGVGFPGWHIECSAMSMEYLGTTLDIHAGGIDHIPVHHTNEIAQSEAATGKEFSRFWVHSNFILVDGKKMSKSLGNFYTLEDVEEHGYSMDVFRLAVISANYRSEAQFSWDVLSSMNERLKLFYAAADLKWQLRDYITENPLSKEDLDYFWQKILGAACNDLNTPIMLREMGQFCSEVMARGVTDDCYDLYADIINNFELLTGLRLGSRTDLNDSQKELLLKRQIARDNKDWKQSDCIRDELLSQGVQINDTRFAQLWSLG